MRWLIIVLLVSLCALLFAVAGLALHIRLQRTASSRKSAADADNVSGPNSDFLLGSVEEANIEPHIERRPI
jgi:uncharacterized membrane protein